MAKKRELNRLEAIIPPIAFKSEDAIVTIYEVTKSRLISGDVWYHVHLDISIGKYRSKRFTLDVRNFDELRRKILIEIAKFKLFIMVGVKT